MKKSIIEFLRRGAVSCGIGPIVLAIVYLILYKNGVIYTLSVNDVCIGIFSLFFLAFVAGGMNFIYQIERLPLMIAISIHGIVLYFSYLATYLINDWIALGKTPILIFTAIFIIGFLAIWAIIYIVIKKKTERINKLLNNK